MSVEGRIVIDHVERDKFIELVEGDVTEMMGAVDLLVISAFPDDYAPTPSSVIGALQRKGISVADLARDKEIDLRENFSCWLSRPIPAYPKTVRFERILCYEHEGKYARASEGVAEIFRALAPFLGSEPRITTVAMPLLATGDQGTPVEEIVEPLVSAAARWMGTSSLKRVQIFVRDPERAKRAEVEFARVKQTIAVKQRRPPQYDVFLSYSHENRATAEEIRKHLQQLRPGMSVYRDKDYLRVGDEYWAKLDKAIRESSRFLSLLSPAYEKSSACKDEFDVAWSIHERSERGFILPCMVETHTPADPRKRKLHYEHIAHSSISAVCQRLLERIPQEREVVSGAEAKAYTNPAEWESSLA